MEVRQPVCSSIEDGREDQEDQRISVPGFLFGPGCCDSTVREQTSEFVSFSYLAYCSI